MAILFLPGRLLLLRACTRCRLLVSHAMCCCPRLAFPGRPRGYAVAPLLCIGSSRAAVGTWWFQHQARAFWSVVWSWCIGQNQGVLVSVALCGLSSSSVASLGRPPTPVWLPSYPRNPDRVSGVRPQIKACCSRFQPSSAVSPKPTGRHSPACVNLCVTEGGVSVATRAIALVSTGPCLKLSPVQWLWQPPRLARHRHCTSSAALDRRSRYRPVTSTTDGEWLWIVVLAANGPCCGMVRGCLARADTVQFTPYTTTAGHWQTWSTAKKGRNGIGCRPWFGASGAATPCTPAPSVPPPMRH